MHGMIGRELFKWDDGAIETLRKMLADGAHFSAIAERTGATRGACIGKARRMGFKSQHAPCVNSSPRKPRKTGEGRKFPNSLTPYFNKWVAPPKPSPIEDVARVTFFNLKNTSCRYPVGDPKDESFGYCGLDEANQIAGRPYCPGHHALVYVKAKVAA